MAPPYPPGTFGRRQVDVRYIRILDLRIRIGARSQRVNDPPVVGEMGMQTADGEQRGRGLWRRGVHRRPLKLVAQHATDVAEAGEVGEGSHDQAASSRQVLQSGHVDEAQRVDAS